MGKPFLTQHTNACTHTHTHTNPHTQPAHTTPPHTDTHTHTCFQLVSVCVLDMQLYGKDV